MTIKNCTVMFCSSDDDATASLFPPYSPNPKFKTIAHTG